MPKKAALTAFFITLLFGFATFTLTYRWNDGYLIWGDGVAYFLYARSVVVDFDTDITNEYEALDDRVPLGAPVLTELRDWAQRSSETGRVIVPWPAGSGLVMSPFYALGYAVELAVAKARGRPVDSFGAIPQFFYGFGALTYGFLGFWATLLCCMRVADKKSAYVSSIASILGGPVLFYVFFQPTMAHAASFGLASLLILLWWHNWADETDSTAALGLLLGILVTIRYQNILFGILLLLLFVRVAWRSSLVSAMARALPAVALFLIPVIFQGAHYLAMHGASAEGIAFNERGAFTAEQNTVNLVSHNFFQVLFSCQHGLFYWTPMLAIGFGGLLFAFWRNGWARAFLAIFLGNVYLIGALKNGAYNWSGGQSFGMRYLTECTPFLATGMAVLLARWHQATAVSLVAWTTVLTLLVSWNIVLILAFSLNTISRLECVTYSEMATGMIEALALTSLWFLSPSSDL